MLRRLSVQKGGGVLSVFLFLQHQLFCLFPDGRLNGCGVVFLFSKEGRASLGGNGKLF